MRIQCLITRSFLTRYVDDELGGRAARLVERHLDRCEECRSRVRRMTVDGRRLRGLEPPAVTDAQWEELWGGIVHRLEEEDGTRPFRDVPLVARRRARYVLLAAAVAVLVAGAVLRLLAGSNQPQQTSISSYIQYHEEAVDGHVFLENHFVSAQVLPVSYAASR